MTAAEPISAREPCPLGGRRAVWGAVRRRAGGDQRDHRHPGDHARLVGAAGDGWAAGHGVRGILRKPARSRIAARRQVRPPSSAVGRHRLVHRGGARGGHRAGDRPSCSSRSLCRVLRPRWACRARFACSSTSRRSRARGGRGWRRGVPPARWRECWATSWAASSPRPSGGAPSTPSTPRWAWRYWSP